MLYKILVTVLVGVCLAVEPTAGLDGDEDIPVVEGFGGEVKVVEEEDVLVLTTDNFLHVVGSKEAILVEFYAPWCGHCKSLAPEYAAAAKELKGEGIRLAKVDATEEEELGKQYDVSGYPTLKLFKKGEMVEDYRGGRTAGALAEYMRMHADPNYAPPPSAVVVLSSSNFSEVIQSKELVLVDFYVPGCKHCDALEPDFEGAARDLKKEGIVLGKVNGIVEKDLFNQFDIKGYPTLIIFRKGRQFEFKGRRDEAGIVEYMREQAKLPSREVATVLEIANNFARTNANVIGFFSEKNDMFEEYIAAANQLRSKLPFFHTFDSSVADRLKLKANTITVIVPDLFHSKYEDKIFKFTKVSGTYKEMVPWIAKKSVSLVGQRTKENMGFKYENRPLIVVYYDVSFSHHYVKGTQIIRNKILPVADKYRDITFAIAAEEEFDEEIKNLGFEDSGEDIHVGVFTTSFKYRMEPEEDFSTEMLEDFVKDFKSGEVLPVLKSQPVPRRQEGPVRVVVARTFEQEVLETADKDVLIEFYAPWCGHCKTLEPVYKKLAKQLAKSHPNLVVAKMDAVANDVHPSFKVEGFPTIFFLRAAEMKPIPYTGDRSLKSLKEFVIAESSSKMPTQSTKDEL
ncbi:Protein disulfide-isomerase A4 [Chionoecetes opilio]|uniref:Protein disulfide-isomerase n=1 Tax=Chionoecetes opilio TaxID=41210 RepID=A0A8J4XLS8_CHIOP|nr:Protein disulfide-isomerase A4 [Chionoecetes opilio]